MNMKFHPLLFFLLTFASVGMAQNSFGVEIRTSRNITYNNSQLIYGFSFYNRHDITREENPTTTSYSAGLLYKIGLKSTFKLHLGRHQNGRIIGIETRDDMGNFASYDKVDIPYNYIQIAPSYAYSLLLGDFSVPIEVGLAINKRIKEEDIFYIRITEYNYDVRLSSGIHYQFDNVSLGVNFLVSKALRDYEFESYYVGEYDLYQLGAELCVAYYFK